FAYQQYTYQYEKPYWYGWLSNSSKKLHHHEYGQKEEEEDEIALTKKKACCFILFISYCIQTNKKKHFKMKRNDINNQQSICIDQQYHAHNFKDILTIISAVYNIC
ncbi:hypothetical protein DOY81_007957, partial [Sarcophaga bullata]